MWICNDINVMNTLNRNEILERVDKNIKVYKNVKMNLYSKIFVINTKIASQVNYIASSVEIDKDTITSLKNKFIDFLWDGKTPKVKYTTIIGDHGEGGIRMIDIESRIKALQMGWIKRSNQGQPWQHIFNSFNKIPWERVINFNIDVSKIGGNFYKCLLRSWQELYFNETFIDNIIKQPVLYNQHLKIGNKMVTKLDDKITIGDILQNNFLVENANLSLLIHGIRKAIPKRIKEFLKTKTNYVSKNGLVKISNKWKSINSFKTKEIYNEYISTKIAKPTAITTLENNLNIQF